MIGVQRMDLSHMETSGADRLQLIAEKRKWQTEIENKKRQLEDDRRALQHLKSKALRERWLLDGASSAGHEQDEVRRQLEQDEAKTRSLEDAVSRLERELVHLEAGGVCESINETTETSGSVKGFKGHKRPETQEAREMEEEMKRAMYSVEIKVERDKVTGETRVLSSHTKLPVDLSHQGVKVYEDEQKVVHEMNGEDGIHLLSSSEVEELLHKAEEVSVMSHTVTTVTSIQTEEVLEEEEGVELDRPEVGSQVTGLEANSDKQTDVAEASTEKPVTMVFMGYQNVEDEDETKKVLGLQGTVKAELVLIEDVNGKTSPGEGKDDTGATLTSNKPPEMVVAAAAAASNGETAAESVKEKERGAVEIKKEKQPCKCCSIM